MSIDCITDCTCKGPGFCSRHGIEKSEKYFRLCQSREDYFKAWEAGQGPGQISGRTTSSVKSKVVQSGIGDVLSKRFESLGMVPVIGCPCKDVQRKLNNQTPAAVLKHLDKWALRLQNSAKKWKELKGGIWNLVPAPPLWLCKKVIQEAVDEVVLRNNNCS